MKSPSALCWLLATAAPGQQQAPHDTNEIEIDVRVERIEQCPANGHEAQRELVEPWCVSQVPLVDWLTDDATQARGARRVVAVDDLERELAVFGTDTVFRFPEVPAGLFAGLGGP
ncbi:MAG: hypothetical protein H6835_16915 [Planctomycetes bacterium]|nr:hypothetical protein [Planctomycetota bacterium]